MIRSLGVIVLATVVFTSFSAAVGTGVVVAGESVVESSPGVMSAFEQRKLEYLTLCVEATHLGNPGLCTQIARLELGLGPLDAGVIESSLAYVDDRNDTSDFAMASLIRILYRYSDSPLLPPALCEQIVSTVLNFKYWIDEPGLDSMCYWSENHQILFASAEYLAGQLFPEEIFSNSGMTGAEHQVKARSRIEQWLERRFYLGFSEWHSNVYYDEDLPALINLVDFIDDQQIAVRAAMVTDILLFDLAVNTHHGAFGVSHGRTYPRHVMGANRESTACVTRLVSGEGIYNSRGNKSGVFLAASPGYKPPNVILAIAADEPEELVNRERMGLNLEDAGQYGLTFEDLESGMFWWGMGGYAAWPVINLTFAMVEEYDLWQNEFFAALTLFEPLWRAGLMPLLCWALDEVTSGSILSQVNTYTYRTPDFMLACAQDQRSGQFGFQTHSWQATLDHDAVVFTCHPASLELESPGYWTGGWMPKAVQEQNVLLSLYEWQPLGLTFPGIVLQFTHAYFPQVSFDAVIQSGHWVFARKDQGYLALYSYQPVLWAPNPEGLSNDLVAFGLPNFWICELGRASDYESFDAFMEALANSTISYDGFTVSYHSPTQGLIETGFGLPFTVEGTLMDIKHYPRYQNPYAVEVFGSNPIVINHGTKQLTLNYETAQRTVID